ncbi:MAG: hypothetical protein ACK559_08200, partial [bacterium]
LIGRGVDGQLHDARVVAVDDLLFPLLGPTRDELGEDAAQLGRVVDVRAGGTVVWVEVEDEGGRGRGKGGGAHGR